MRYRCSRGIQQSATAYYNGAKAAFIVYDVTRRGTLENVVFWHDDRINIIRKKMPIILTGNKTRTWELISLRRP